MATQTFYPDSGLESNDASFPGVSFSYHTEPLASTGSGSYAYYLTSDDVFTTQINRPGSEYIGGYFFLDNYLSLGFQSGVTDLNNFVQAVVNGYFPSPTSPASKLLFQSYFAVYSGTTFIENLTGPSTYTNESFIQVNDLNYNSSISEQTINSSNFDFENALDFNTYFNDSNYRFQFNFTISRPNVFTTYRQIDNIRIIVNGETVLSEDKQMTLYISGPTPSSGNIPLYLHSPLPSGDIPLFIEGHEEAEPTGIPLYTQGGETVSSGLDLYINSDVNNNFDLFIKSLDPVSKTGSMPLYIHTDNDAVALATKEAPLFIKNFENHSGNAPLYIAGPASGELYNSFPMYVKVEEPEVVVTESGSYNNSIGLFVSGPVEFTNYAPLFLHATPSGNSSIPLYMNSENGANLSNNAPLFISNLIHYSSGNMQLYTKGPDSGVASIPFFIKSIPIADKSTTLFTRNEYYDIDSSNIPLVVQNKLEQSGGISLHTIANTYVTDLPLYLKVNELINTSGNLGLFINSTEQSSLFSTTNLYMSSDVYGTRIPLYIKTDSIGYSSGNIPLYINAGYLSNKSLDLYIPNSGESTIGTVRLTVAGEGITPEGYVSRSGIPLYISRDDESVSSAINLVINGPTGQQSGVDFYINGGSYIAATLELSIPSSIGPSNSEMKLYTHGF